MSNISYTSARPKDVRSHFSFNSSCFQTNGFFQPRVVYMREVNPKEEINVNISTLTRTKPMVKPTYGNVDVVNVAFFVPWRCLIPNFKYTMTGVPVVNTAAEYPTLRAFPKIACQTFARYVTSKLCTSGTSTTYDFVIPPKTSGDTPRYYILTSEGKIMYYWLRSLGYTIDIAAASQSSSFLSLLPIMSYLRIVKDYVVNKVFDSSIITLIETVIVHLNRETSEEAQMTYLDFVRSGKMFNLCYFDTDVFNTASAAASGYNTENAAYTRFASDSQQSISVTSQAQPYMTIANNSKLNQVALDSLRRITDSYHRLSLAGRDCARAFALRWGIKLREDVYDVSYCLGSHRDSLQISDVMSTASTTEMPIGDYGAKAYGRGSASFHYKTNEEFGYFMVVQVIKPKAEYLGMPMHMLHVAPEDLFNPEYDGMGLAPIPSVCASERCQAGSVLGFTSQYWEHKSPLPSLLNGDATIFSSANENQLWTQYTSWYLYRLLGTELAQSADFRHGTNTLEWCRIFADTQDPQPFIQNVFISEELSRPMTKLLDNYDYDLQHSEAKQNVNADMSVL